MLSSFRALGDDYSPAPRRGNGAESAPEAGARAHSMAQACKGGKCAMSLNERFSDMDLATWAGNGRIVWNALLEESMSEPFQKIGTISSAASTVST